MRYVDYAQVSAWYAKLHSHLQLDPINGGLRWAAKSTVKPTLGEFLRWYDLYLID